MKKSFLKKCRREDGQAMVEFALILPIFLLILCGIIIVFRPALLEHDHALVALEQNP